VILASCGGPPKALDDYWEDELSDFGGLHPPALPSHEWLPPGLKLLLGVCKENCCQARFWYIKSKYNRESKEDRILRAISFLSPSFVVFEASSLKAFHGPETTENQRKIKHSRQTLSSFLPSFLPCCLYKLVLWSHFIDQRHSFEYTASIIQF
jgi:hypothetical protein